MEYVDRTKETTVTTGTGNILLAGAPSSSFAAFADGYAVNDQVPYEILHQTLNEFEIGIGTLIDGAHLRRDTVLKNSNKNTQLVNFSAGTKDVFVTVPGTRLSKMAAPDAPLVTVLANPTTATLTVEDGGAFKRIKMADYFAQFGQSLAQLNAAGALSGANMFGLVQDGTNEVRADLDTLCAWLKVKFDALYAASGSTGGTTPTDTTPPVFATAQVSNATPTVIQITMSENLANSVPPASAFAVSGGKTVSSVAVSGLLVSLTCNSAYVNGNAITVTYTKPSSGAMLQDAAGNATLSFGPSAVTNNVAAAGDTVQPTASAAAVANSTPTIVAITMSEPLDTNFVPAASAFTVGGHTVSSVAISGSVINLTVSAAFVNGEAARTVAYTQPGANNARDLAGNLLASFTGLAITNNVAAASSGHTIAPYTAGNTVKTALAKSAADGTYTNAGSYFAPTKAMTTPASYFNITPNVAAGTNVRCGWSKSNTVPPAEITAAQNASGDLSVNGLVPMADRADPAWENVANLWVSTADLGVPFYLWFRIGTEDICYNAAGGLVVS
jgi:hypothetical protein